MFRYYLIDFSELSSEVGSIIIPAFQIRKLKPTVSEHQASGSAEA